MMRWGRRRTELALCVGLIGAAPALAITAETIAYTYDAQGRLAEVERSRNVNNGVNTSYTHDGANNRANVTVTGSPNPPPPK